MPNSVLRVGKRVQANRSPSENARARRRRLAWQLRRDGQNAVQVPLLRDALELVHTSVLEHKSRTCGQVLHGRRDEELARFGETCDSSTDVHAEPADLPVDHLDFTGVHSCPHVEAEGLHSVDDRSAASHGPRGTIERRKESIPGGVHLRTPVAR